MRSSAPGGTSRATTILPGFDDRGLLPPGDYELTIDQIRDSPLVVGPPGRPSWDRAWRSFLLDNLAILAGHLWSAGVVDIFVGGSFASLKDRPADLDGYFVCDRDDFKSYALNRRLERNDPFGVWTWDKARRRPGHGGKPKLPMWHTYRVELLPYYGQPTTGVRDAAGRDLAFPEFYRNRLKDQDIAPRGLIKLVGPSG